MILGSFDFSAATADAVQQSVVTQHVSVKTIERNRKRVVRVLADKASATLADGMVSPLRNVSLLYFLQYQPTGPQGQAKHAVNPLWFLVNHLLAKPRGLLLQRFDKQIAKLNGVVVVLQGDGAVWRNSRELCAFDDGGAVEDH